MRLFVLLFLGATTPVAAQEPVFPQLPAGALAGEGTSHACHPEGLAGTARCGVFRVWEDREARQGRTIDIAFVVLEATDGPALGDAIIFLPGGPGQAFTSAAGSISGGIGVLRSHRDVVLVDVRGVGRSASLSCNVPYPGGLASRFGALFPTDHAALCRDSLSRRARLDRYTTASSVDDLEDLRAWLGYAQWNLNGGSYGTRVAQVYMRRHPVSVRTVVLNGVAPINRPLYVHHAFLLQRALDRLVDECVANEACHVAYPDLTTDVPRLFARFDAGPVRLEVHGEQVGFTAADLASALRGLLYGRGQDVPALVTEAARGNLTPLAEYYTARTNWVGAASGEAGYHFSVLCAEDIAPLTDADVADATRGTFMGAHFINAYRAVCRLWPYARLPESHWTPVQSDIPTLLLSGGRDPVTPAEGAEEVAASLRHSVHFVVPNAGHGVGGPCIERMVTRLVETGSVEGLDPSCIEGVPPTRFRVPREPPPSGRPHRGAGDQVPR